MAETPELLTIGEFSRLTRLSVRMLPHYSPDRVAPDELVTEVCRPPA